MNGINIYCAVVIYNKQCGESTTCDSISRLSNLKVIVIDNSTENNENEQYCQQKGWHYIDMGGNKGLAKAYNRAEQAIDDHNAVLCLFDDDSVVAQGYLDGLCTALEQQPDKKILMPLIYDKAGLMSPSTSDGLAIRRADKLEDLTQQNISGVNSGMAIRREVFDDYQYDEGYFLDYIDHAFLRDMRRLGNKIGYFKADFQHEAMFESEEATVDSVCKRFKLFKKDFRRYCGRTFNGRKNYYWELYRQKKHFFLTIKPQTLRDKLRLFFL